MSTNNGRHFLISISLTWTLICNDSMGPRYWLLKKGGLSLIKNWILNIQFVVTWAYIWCNITSWGVSLWLYLIFLFKLSVAKCFWYFFTLLCLVCLNILFPRLIFLISSILRRLRRNGVGVLLKILNGISTLLRYLDGVIELCLAKLHLFFVLFSVQVMLRASQILESILFKLRFGSKQRKWISLRMPNHWHLTSFLISIQPLIIVTDIGTVTLTFRILWVT